MAFCLVVSMLLAGCVNPLAEIETIPYQEELHLHHLHLARLQRIITPCLTSNMQVLHILLASLER